MCVWIPARRLAYGNTTSAADGSEVDFCRCTADCSLIGSSFQMQLHLNSRLSSENAPPGLGMRIEGVHKAEGVGKAWIMINVLFNGGTYYASWVHQLLSTEIGDKSQPSLALL